MSGLDYFNPDLFYITVRRGEEQKRFRCRNSPKAIETLKKFIAAKYPDYR